MRRALIHYLFSLSDLNYQKECWLNGRCPEKIGFDDFDQAIHLLYDDTVLASDTEREVGYTLKDSNEVDLVKNVCKKINQLFEKYGKELSDKEYIDCPEWSDILKSSKKAYDFISNG